MFQRVKRFFLQMNENNHKLGVYGSTNSYYNSNLENKNENFIQTPKVIKLLKPNKSRIRTSFEQHQLDNLERVFEMTHYPDAYFRSEIAAKTGLTDTKVQVS
jgi:hypothetical protein